MSVHRQLVCLLPVGILKLLSLFQQFALLALKSPSEDGGVVVNQVHIILQLQVNALGEWIIGIYLHEFTNNEREISIPHEAAELTFLLLKLNALQKETTHWNSYILGKPDKMLILKLISFKVNNKLSNNFFYKIYPTR